MEPRVLARDVKAALRAAIRPDDDEGESVVLISEKAGISTRTIYRILGDEYEDLSLDMADRLLIACDGDLRFCELVPPAGVE